MKSFQKKNDTEQPEFVENNDTKEQECYLSEVAKRLVWKDVPKEELEEDFISGFFKDPQKSYALKLLENNFVPYPEKEIPVPPQNSKVSAFYVPGVEGSHFTPYPLYSRLTRAEQHKLYTFYCILKNRKLTDSELKQYNVLHDKARSDFSAYQELVSTEWINHHFARTKQVDSSVIRYIDFAWEMKTKFCLDTYPSRYNIKHRSDIPLTLNDPNDDFTILDSLKTIYAHGDPPRMSIPLRRFRCELVKDFNDLCRIKPLPEPDPSMEPVTSITLPVSMDEDVTYCLNSEDMNIDVVMSVSAVKTLVDCYSRQRDWILPVIIRKVEVPQKDSKGYVLKTIVTIDKKLPPSVMSVHDKNVLHAKQTAKWALILNKFPNLLQDKTVEPTSSRMSKATKRSSSGIVSAVKKLDFNFEKEIKETETHTEEKKIISTTDKKQNLPSPETFYTAPSPSTPAMTDSGVGLKQPWDDSDKVFSFDDSSRQFPSPQPSRRRCLFNSKERFLHQSYVYRKWDLHKSMSFAILKGEQRHLNILIRSKVDGYLLSNQKSDGNSLLKEVCISSKLEFQPEFGASKPSKSELVREYIDLLLRPNTSLVRVRSIGYTGEVMLCELKTLSELRDSLLCEKVPVQRVFDPLYAVLTNLIDQPGGTYILRHTSKMNSFAQLMLSDVDGNSLNLWQYFEKLQEEVVKLPPPQIDPYLLTAIHYRDKKPPATLRPAYEADTAKFFRKPHKPSGRPKRNQKKRKKQCEK